MDVKILGQYVMGDKISLGQCVMGLGKDIKVAKDVYKSELAKEFLGTRLVTCRSKITE